MMDIRYLLVYLAVFVGTFSPLPLFSQEQKAMAESVEMADGLRASGKIYVVVVVMTLLFVGVLAYMTMLDRKIRKLEEE